VKAERVLSFSLGEKVAAGRMRGRRANIER
jgi:hypothetical protein